MSRREDIDIGIWSDPDFAALAPDTKAGYIWSFTNSHCGMSGLYKLRYGTLAFELGVDRAREDEIWRELGNFAYYEGGVVLVRTRVKHLRTRGHNMAVSIASDVAKIDPRHPLRIRFLETYGSLQWLAPLLDPLRAEGDDALNQALSENPSKGLPEGFSERA